MKSSRLFIMLWTFMVLLVAIPITGTAQNLKVSYQDTPIEEVISDLKKKTNLNFVYQKQLLENVPNVTGNYENMGLTDILDKIFLGQGLDYDLVRNTVIIRKIDSIKSGNKRKINGKVWLITEKHCRVFTLQSRIRT